MSYKLLIARFPGDGSEYHKTVSWLMQLTSHLTKREIEHRTISIADTPVTMSRNKAVRFALDNGFDYILMIDSDMIPDIEADTDPKAMRFFSTAWAMMMQRRIAEAEGVKDLQPATIAAPYCGPSPEELVYVFQWDRSDVQAPTPNFRLKMIDRRDAAVRGGIQEVAALPTGLILYDARVFKKLPAPWFEYEYDDEEKSNKVTTEDVFQTRNASLLGMPQFVAWDCWAGHAKTRIVGKPVLMTPDQVSGHLRDALLNHPKGTRIEFIHEHGGSEIEDLESIEKAHPLQTNPVRLQLQSNDS